MKNLFNLLLLFVGLSVNGQQFFSTNLSTEQGLPSNQVYDVIQDNDGFIWIATDAGVTKYDGNKIESFQQADGLADNSIVQMRIAPNGTIWFLGFNKSFTLYSDSFQAYEFNDKLNDILQKELISSFFPKNDQKLIIGLNSPCETNYSGLKISANKIESYKSSDQPNSWFEADKQLFNITNCKQQQPNFPKQMQALSSNADLTVINTNRDILLYSNTILKSSLKTKDRLTKALLLDSKGNIWAGTYNGLLFFPKGDLTVSPWRIETNQPISCVTEDRDGSIWFGTFSKGLFHIPSSSIHYYNDITDDGNNDFRGIISTNDRIVAYNRSNSVIELRSGENGLTAEKTWVVNDNISQLFYTEDKLNILTENQFDEQKFIADFKGIAIANSAEQNTFWVGGLYYFSKITNGKEVFNSVQLDFQERVNCLVETNKNELWLGTVNGLYHFANNTIIPVSGTENTNITCVALSNENIVFGTSGKGIGMLKSEEITWFDNENGLANNFVNAFCIDNSEIWIGTKAGLSRLANGEIATTNRFKGLLFEDINGLKKVSDKLLLATSNGIVSCSIDYLNQEIPPLPVSILLNQKEVDSTGSITFDFDQQNITIDLLTFDYFQKEKTTFRYRLNSDSTWNTTQQRRIRYESLPPGNYLFEIEAQNRNGQFNPKGSSFSIEIKPPFYQTTLFYLLSASGIGLLFFLLFRWQLAKNNKRMQIENELSALKIKALSAQMNPHFIFNSLNSIQNFLIDSDLRKSNKYLTKFAKLMRLVLNNSDKTFVPLKDVLSSLDLYMELEKLRFNERFDYKFEIDPKIELETTHIPSMLIQPFVENAILHGILPREGKGKIEVALKFVSNNSLMCTITDDGVGRDFHKGKIGKKHKSQGLRITKERLEVFKQLFKSEFEFSFHDLKDEVGKPKGTKVELSVPSR